MDGEGPLLARRIRGEPAAASARGRGFGIDERTGGDEEKES